MRHIYDNIHGNIEFTDIETKFIDNRWFKRLKRIKQLGLLDHVWPCASHTRFEHSLGVAYLSSSYINTLIKNNHGNSTSSRFTVSDTDKQCIKLAGMLHDVGHGPFSHVFDTALVKKYKNKLNHETRSRNIVEHIFKEIGTKDGFSDATMIDKIKDMIEPSNKDAYNTLPIFNIVNNTINSIDVDKFDYLLRDPKHIGLDYSFNYNRIFIKSSVIGNDIVYDSSITDNIMDLFLTRHRFHRDIYNHKTVKIIELMFEDVLCKYMDTIDINDDFISLDDSIYTNILYSTNKDLEPCKKILQKIENRDLYKQLWCGNKYDFDINDHKFAEYKENELKIVNMKFNLCNDDNCPLTNVKFIKDGIVNFGTVENMNKLYPNKYEQNITIVCTSVGYK